MFDPRHRADRTRRSRVSLRALRLIVPVTASVLALALHGAAVAPAAPVTLFANVGPSEQIGLTDASGARVTQLPAGSYTIVVNDQTSDHNFHLTGPGVDMSTTVSFVGQVTWTLDLATGSYRFQCDPHNDAMFGTFTVVTPDTTPPETTITAGPTGAVNTTTANFSFSSNETGATFECALDTAAFAACTSPRSYTALAAGQHNFQVRAIDAAGNVDATPAARAWTVDTTPPDTTITAGPSGTVGSTSASFSFTSTDSTASFQCSLDSTTAYTACTSPKSYTGLAGGAHTFRVRAIDPAGNLDASPASRAWTIDTTPPDTTITLAPDGTVASGDASFEFTSTKAGSTFACSLDGEAFAACSSPASYFGLADGTHTFQVRAIDAAGNVDATPAVASWTIDTTPPETTIVSGPAALVSSGAAAFSFSSSEAGSSFECSLDGEAFAACSSPQSYNGLADGAHTFDVRATDAAGNLDTSPANAGWTVDTAAPDTTIDSGPTDTVGSRSASFSFSSSEAGSSYQCALDGAAFAACTSPKSYTGLTDGVHMFQVRSTDLAGNLDTSAASRTWTIDSTALYGTVGPGFTITLTDAAGTPVTQLDVGSYRIVVHDLATAHNFHLSGPGVDMSTTVTFSGEVIWTLTLSSGSYRFQCDPHTGMEGTFTVGSADTTPPDTTIASGPSGSVASGSASFGFSSSEAGSTFECALDGAAFSACSSPVSYTGLADGAHSFQVRATDAAGNTDATPAGRSWIIDTTPPETTITAGPAGTVTSTSASFDFSAGESGATFACSLDGAPFSACTSPQSYDGLAAGTHTFQVRAADALGNADATPASRTWTVQAADTTPPETTISSGPAALANVSSASFAFSASEAGATFACSLDGAAFTACSSPNSYSGLADGSHSFQVRATDAAGNTDTTPAARSWTVDTVAPDTTITAGPSGTVTSTSASFSFSSSEAGSSYQCALDGSAYAACGSPKSYTGLAAGTHTFQVRAVDAAGNADATPAASTWTVEAATTPNTLYAQVSDESIWLKDSSGNLVSNLDPGTYTIVVRDLSAEQNFRLKGPGVDRETSESGTGTVTWTVTFVSGEYEYRSDEDSDLKREFYVGSGEHDDGDALDAQVSDESIWLKDSSGNLVSRVDPGTYTIVVRDLSDEQNFRLKGPGVDRETSESETGTVTWTITFVSGEYEYRSDEESDLKREFYVGSGEHDD